MAIAFKIGNLQSYTTPFTVTKMDVPGVMSTGNNFVAPFSIRNLALPQNEEIFIQMFDGTDNSIFFKIISTDQSRITTAILKNGATTSVSDTTYDSLGINPSDGDYDLRFVVDPVNVRYDVRLNGQDWQALGSVAISGIESVILRPYLSSAGTETFSLLIATPSLTEALSAKLTLLLP